MTRTTNSAAIAAAVLLTLLTLQQAITVPANTALVVDVRLA